MKIEQREITVAELSAGYSDNQEGGVLGYSGKLDIRPPYQREFVYKDKQRAAVVDTVTKDFPLNVMYWAVRGDGTFEVIDGQQRTISICQYVTGEFSFRDLYFHNLPADKRNQILDYKLTVYLCSGTDSDRLDWFRTINIAGEKLTDQELRNAVYSGPWVTDAKRYFSKTSGPAYGLAGDYLSGHAIRQEYLETVIDWISGGQVEDYMGKHQHDSNATELWDYFTNVIAWVEKTFPKKRKPMKGLPWGTLYNTYKNTNLDPVALEKRVAKLFADFEVENKKGIYLYILDGQEKHLNLRQFDEPTKLSTYEKQKGICPMCNTHFEYKDMAGDHIKPWSKGGKTEPKNCQMLCVPDNIKKSNR